MIQRVIAVFLATVGLGMAGCATAGDGAAAPLETTSDVAGCSESEVASTGRCGDVVASEQAPAPGVSASGAPPAGGGAAGACLEGATECNDMPGGTPAGPPGDVLAVEPRDELVDLRAIPWESVQPVDADQTVLEVTFWGGNEACEGLDEVGVELSGEAVTITVVTGQLPDAGICDASAVLKATEVDLGEPLGPRSILDGAASSSESPVPSATLVPSDTPSG